MGKHGYTLQHAVLYVAMMIPEQIYRVLPVATLAAPMRRGGSQNAVGNLLADAMRLAAGTDIGMWNNGGIRADLAAGD